ncbi:MAG TPA: hypothetical protein DDY98_00820 [Ruminococcaceae bacterium]|nr:hypothetical protein [Oscillospiraceae bacterium]
MNERLCSLPHYCITIHFPCQWVSQYFNEKLSYFCYVACISLIICVILQLANRFLAFFKKKTKKAIDKMKEALYNTEHKGKGALEYMLLGALSHTVYNEAMASRFS